jgi:hypothetical protein
MILPDLTTIYDRYTNVSGSILETASTTAITCAPIIPTWRFSVDV